MAGVLHGCRACGVRPKFAHAGAAEAGASTEERGRDQGSALIGFQTPAKKVLNLKTHQFLP